MNPTIEAILDRLRRAGEDLSLDDVQECLLPFPDLVDADSVAPIKSYCRNEPNPVIAGMVAAAAAASPEYGGAFLQQLVESHVGFMTEAPGIGFLDELESCAARHPAVVGEIASKLSGSDSAARRKGAVVLAWLVRNDPESFEIMRRLCRDVDDGVARMAIGSLVDFEQRFPVRSLLRVVLDEAVVRGQAPRIEVAAHVLANSGSAEDLAFLQSLAKSSKSAAPHLARAILELRLRHSNPVMRWLHLGLHLLSWRAL